MLRVKKQNKNKLRNILHNWLQYRLRRKGERRRRKGGGLVMVTNMWLSWSHYNNNLTRYFATIQIPQNNGQFLVTCGYKRRFLFYLSIPVIYNYCRFLPLLYYTAQCEALWVFWRESAAELSNFVVFFLHCTTLGSGDSSVVERWTRDRKVSGSSPGRSGGIFFFSRVNFLRWLLFRYPFHPRVAAKKLLSNH